MRACIAIAKGRACRGGHGDIVGSMRLHIMMDGIVPVVVVSRHILAGDVVFPGELPDNVW